MQQVPVKNIYLTIDLRQSRIRIYKSVLHMMGDPKYIQLLVSPQRMAVALRPLKYPTSNDQSHRIVVTANCVEINSQTFVNKLCSCVGELDANYSYRLTGFVRDIDKVAIFTMRSIEKILL